MEVLPKNPNEGFFPDILENLLEEFLMQNLVKFRMKFIEERLKQ